MAKAEYWCWVCEFSDCGHVWLVMGGKTPEKCARCRRRGWNKPEQSSKVGVVVKRVQVPEVQQSKTAANVSQFEKCPRKAYHGASSRFCKVCGWEYQEA